MRKVTMSVATSLDGYIAGPAGEADWIVMDPDVDFAAMMGRFDTLVMGRKTWEMTQTRGRSGGGMPGLDVYVFSRTLKQADCPGAVVSADPARTIRALKEAAGKDIWVFGGGELFRSLLELGAVDSVEVAVIPVLLGDGIPLLPSPAPTAGLKLERQHVYEKTGTVLLEYSVV